MSSDAGVRAFNQQLIPEFRASNGHGELGPVHFERMLLLTTTGRRSGAEHTVPLGYARDGDGDLILFGSNAGSPVEPDWVRNLRVDPRVRVEMTDLSFEADAEILAGAQRAQAYRHWVDALPHTADHEAKAGREIPIIRVPVPR